MKLRITVDGVAYDVEVEVLDNGPAPAPSAPPPPAASAPPPSAPPPRQAAAPVTGDACTSPLAGNVLAVHVQPGDAVEQNQTVVVLEAMKMETKVASPRAGTVKAVRVSVGDTVRSGEVMVEFE